MRKITIRTNPQERLVQVASVIICYVVVLIISVSTVEEQLQSLADPLIINWKTKSARVVQSVRTPFYVASNYYGNARAFAQMQENHAQLLAELSALEQLREENIALRKMLENTARNLEERKVVSPITSYASPAIAGGTDQGIEVGALLLFADTLLGVVKEVSSSQSEVLLLTQKQAIEVIAETESGVKGIVTGDGKQVLFTHVLPNEQIVTGEKIISSGQPGIKRGLFIGTVAGNSTSNSAPFQTATVEQYVSFYSTPAVEVL